MKIEGDEALIAHLKEMSKQNKGYLKFLITEARSNTKLTAGFKGPDGGDCTLTLDRETGNLIVKKA